MLLKIKCFLASGFGLGYFPKSPGTVTSLICTLTMIFLQLNLEAILIFLAAFILIAFISIPAAEECYGHDAACITIDEWIGQTIALLFIPQHIVYYLISFLLFRFFDILKPFPIYQLQKLPSTFGVICDDILAGVFSCVIFTFLLEMVSF